MPRKLLPVAIAAVILSSQLLVKPIVGLADNGDFVNVTWPLRLEPVDTQGRYFDYVVPQWRYDPTVESEVRLITSEWLVIAPSYLLSRVFLGGVYDLRWAGLTHMLLFLWALWLVAAPVARLPGWRAAAVWAAMLAVLCDVVYFSTYNSFYMDAASLLFLLLSCAFYARLACEEGSARWNAWGLAAALFLFLTSKLQHAILAAVVVAFLLLDARIAKQFSRRAVLAIGAVFLLCVVGMFRHVPKYYSTYAAYNVVFTALLPVSPNPGALLDEFGLPRELQTLTGGSAFRPDSGVKNPAYRDLVARNLTHTRLLGYYLRHPEAAAMMIRNALRESARERQKSRGNFAREAGVAPQTPSRAFAVVSGLRRAAFDDSPWLYAAYLMVTAAAALWSARGGGAAVAVGALILMAAGEFFLGALADCQETTRHLFLFRALLDLVLISLVAFAPAGRLPPPRKR